MAVAQARTFGAESTVNFTNSAGNHFLLGVNGVDTYFSYDGTTFATPTTTGVTTSTLTQLFIFKRRVWAVQKNTQSVWYLDIDSIAGTWIEFPIGALLTKGGYLVAGSNWTLDGGTGSDDNLILISSEGEVLVYQGSSPAAASSFQLVGVYQIGKPLSKYCFQKVAGDVLISTDRGLTPASKLSTSDAYSSGMVSYQIQPTWQALAKSLGMDNGWQSTIYPLENALLINIPSNAVGDPDQIVFNLNTGAPCTFSNWPAVSLTTFLNILYYGNGTGTVYKAWSTDSLADAGQDVVASCQQAYNYFGSMREALKHVELLRFQLSFTAGVQVEWSIGVDFQLQGRYTSVPRDLTFTPAVWDVSLWDVSFWEVQARRLRSWFAFLHPPGYAISLLLRTTTKFAVVRWSGTDLQIATGRGLG